MSAKQMQPYFNNFVVTYLNNRNWLLKNPQQFAQSLWSECEAGTLSYANYGELRAIIYRRYSAVVCAECRAENAGKQERAWQELRHHLVKNARKKMPNFPQWEEAVQESLISTYAYLQADRVKKPEQFLNLARTMLHNQMIDMARHLGTQKQGGGNVDSLEMLMENTHEQISDGLRNTEQVALFRVAEGALSNTFHEVLSTPNQKEVAKMYFLQHLKPREIAQEMGKTPHEVRQTVARVKKRMQEFLPEATKWLPPPPL